MRRIYEAIAAGIWNGSKIGLLIKEAPAGNGIIKGGKQNEKQSVFIRNGL